MRQSLGLLEVAGLLPAITVADAMAKTANVSITSVEPAKGSGWHTVKIEGSVDAVTAAIDAGSHLAESMGAFVAKKVIPRPDTAIFDVFAKEETEIQEPEPVEEVVEEVAEVEEVPEGLEELEPQIEKIVEKVEEAQLEEVEKSEEEPKKEATCNLCGDPNCPRIKGEPKTSCIHYKK